MSVTPYSFVCRIFGGLLRKPITAFCAHKFNPLYYILWMQFMSLIQGVIFFFWVGCSECLRLLATLGNHWHGYSCHSWIPSGCVVGYHVPTRGSTDSTNSSWRRKASQLTNTERGQILLWDKIPGSPPSYDVVEGRAWGRGDAHHAVVWTWSRPGARQFCLVKPYIHRGYKAAGNLHKVLKFLSFMIFSYEEGLL